MAFGQNPAEVRAAEQARQEAIALAASRPMSPFERKLIGVLEDIRDNSRPVALEPIVGEAVTGRCCLDWLSGSSTQVLTRAIAAGGRALSDAFPTFREDLTAAGFETFAAVAIAAALREASRDPGAETSEVQQGAEEEAGDGEPPAGPSSAVGGITT